MCCNQLTRFHGTTQTIYRRMARGLALTAPAHSDALSDKAQFRIRWRYVSLAALDITLVSFIMLFPPPENIEPRNSRSR
ncbi:hypothetical protein CPB86DRAFT_786626 [Serendipita vermifera]|nr:hypothetical protein CPB86DRAFT_786626 [Serendipita vermifera]